jgi:hypothetical protein
MNFKKIKKKRKIGNKSNYNILVINLSFILCKLPACVASIYVYLDHQQG